MHRISHIGVAARNLCTFTRIKLKETVAQPARIGNNAVPLALAFRECQNLLVVLS